MDIPENKKKAKPITQDDKTLNNGESNLTAVKSFKEKPKKTSKDVMDGSLISDIGAYYKGVVDGRELLVNEILELAAENETPDELAETCPSSHAVIPDIAEPVTEET